MYKFLFNIITDPLGLPIPAVYEFIIIIIISLVAYKIAWDASPGGDFGSLIHWIVRLIVTLVIWAITYFVFWMIKWIIANWILVLIIFVILGAIISIRALLIKNKEKVKTKT